MDTTSLWKAISKRIKTYPAIDQELSVDVVIIGGGITGVTTALQLINANKKVAIIEAENIGGVTTGSSTGNLYVAVQPYYQHIATKFDLATAKRVAYSRQFAMDYIHKNIQEKNIDCHFSRRPWYMSTHDEKMLAVLEKEFEIFKKMDMPINYTENLPFNIKFKKAIMLENQARFNPLQYVISLAEDLQKKGCLIFENTRVTEIVEKKGECLLNTEPGFKVKANKVIIATHTPIGINNTQFFIAPYRSYVVSVHLENNKYPEGHLWDLSKTHHAICTHGIFENRPELLMVAGSHHRVGQGGDMELHYQELESYLRKNFAVSNIAYKWSAQHYQSADDVPYIGLASRFAKHTYLATGYFADGLIYGTLAGMLISDLILGKKNEWKTVYCVNRFTPKASVAFLIKEDTNTFAQYYKDLPKSHTKDFSDIKIGEGKVVDIDREKCGVYRDENQKLHCVSAVCTHMKCIVNWNNAEKTWDCPCHGSRFSIEGKVIEGPATQNLKNKEI